MKNTELLAIVDAIKTGFWNCEQLSLVEFEAIHAAVTHLRQQVLSPFCPQLWRP